MADLNAEFQEQPDKAVRPISPITLALTEGRALTSIREITFGEFSSESGQSSLSSEVNYCDENEVGKGKAYSSKDNANSDIVIAKRNEFEGHTTHNVISNVANSKDEGLVTKYGTPTKPSKKEGHAWPEGDRNVGGNMARAVDELSKDVVSVGANDNFDGKIFVSIFSSNLKENFNKRKNFPYFQKIIHKYPLQRSLILKLVLIHISR